MAEPFNRSRLDETLYRVQASIALNHAHLEVGGRFASPYLPGSVEVMSPAAIAKEPQLLRR